MRFKNFLLKSKLVICIVVGVFLVLVVSTAVIISTVTSQEEKLAYQKSIEMASSYANQFDVDNMIEAFRNSQHRVKSMALAHEKLYQSEDMVSVDFADYLKNLVDYLFQSYSLDSGKVSLKLDVEKVFGNGQGCSLGIIVNELVSNSLKHTFSGEKEGEIYIALRRSTEYSTLQENNLENYGNTKSRQQKNERTAPNGKIENKEEKLIL